MQIEASRAQVLVTGASGVLGGAIVRALCENRSREAAQNVVATYHRNHEAAQILRNETGCTLARVEFGDEKQVAQLFAQHAHLNAVVHAAGVSRDNLLLRTSRDDWQHTLRVNLDSAFWVLRAALNGFGNGGRVVLLASRVGENGARGQSAYAASKAALIALTKSAAREGAAQGIAINAICPAFTVSPLTPPGVENLQAARAQDVFGKLGHSDSTARLARWLLSAEARGISGQVFHADARLG